MARTQEYYKVESCLIFVKNFNHVRSSFLDFVNQHTDFTTQNSEVVLIIEL